jgi:hypothetical protein
MHHGVRSSDNRARLRSQEQHPSLLYMSFGHTIIISNQIQPYGFFLDAIDSPQEQHPSMTPAPVGQHSPVRPRSLHAEFAEQVDTPPDDEEDDDGDVLVGALAG